MAQLVDQSRRPCTPDWRRAASTSGPGAARFDASSAGATSIGFFAS
jgi:hypothetical protein